MEKSDEKTSKGAISVYKIPIANVLVMATIKLSAVGV